MANLAIARLSEGENSEYFAARGELKVWLRALGGKLAVGSGLTFALMKAQGCRTVGLSGREVAGVCFQNGGLSFHL